ncbi:MAG TPA: glutaredoxin domain-containing protein [Anaeromyxobacter sp.]|nr:glutaredoxin domain-containing protein [Anaeromyxobacter sp.]
MRLAIVTVILLTPVLGPATARADVFTWVDESGTVHFSEEPPAGPKRAKKVILPADAPRPEPEEANPTSTQSAPKPAVTQPPAPRPAAAKPFPPVELFSTSWCPHCKRARAYFQGKGIPFTDHDIEHEKDARARLLTLTGSEAVPAAVIGGKLVKGYAPEEYQAALGQKR